MDEFTAAVNGEISAQVREISRQNRTACAEVLSAWLAFTAEKRPSPDLPAKIADARKRFADLADKVVLDFDGKKAVLKADGEAGEILRQLRRGTSWFTPFTDVDSVIITTLLGGHST